MSPFRKLCGLLAAMALAACGPSEPSMVAGGSGTEAENALTVTARAQDGSLVTGALVEVWPSTQVPGLGGAQPSFRDTTDSLGQSRLTLRAGNWSILVRKGGLAFRSVVGPLGALQDTLRPMASLAGAVESGAGLVASLPGLGVAVLCDSLGNFHFDSLPSGNLSVVVTGATSERVGVASLAPGSEAVVLVRAGALPDRLVLVPTDSLVHAGATTPPLAISRAVLGDTGAFALAMTFERSGTSDSAWLVDWKDASAGGVRLGWIGQDTLALDVGGKSYRIEGVPLDTGLRQVGLGWTGTALEVWLDGDLVISLATQALLDRSTWTDPVIASAGVAKVDWLTFKRGILPAGWFPSLAGK